ncbi:hypothetical protein NE237_025865 [Protea cynaroides]|uniref:Uncharacterized protein n=1 Tax=Protea cynaroides TaxID=273540 RepID=A0A9Q0H3X5_9MAGN|nr:hypothetical protein NE237_025865 [Protea cynaroides]
MLQALNENCCLPVVKTFGTSEFWKLQVLIRLLRAQHTHLEGRTVSSTPGPAVEVHLATRESRFDEKIVNSLNLAGTISGCIGFLAAVFCQKADAVISVERKSFMVSDFQAVAFTQ